MQRKKRIAWKASTHDDRLKSLRQAGKSNEEIASEMGFSRSTILARVNALGLAHRAPGMSKGTVHQHKAERNQRILQASRSGQDIPRIAREHGLTEVRIWQIIKTKR